LFIAYVALSLGICSITIGNKYKYKNNMYVSKGKWLHSISAVSYTTPIVAAAEKRMNIQIMLFEISTRQFCEKS
jgi:hypothetical protein